MMKVCIAVDSSEISEEAFECEQLNAALSMQAVYTSVKNWIEPICGFSINSRVFRALGDFEL